MGDSTKGGVLDGLDALDLTSGRSSTLFDPQPDGSEQTLVDPTAVTSAGSPRAANDPRRALHAKPAAATLALPAGFRLFEYRIDSVLGQGGFGIAYAATDVNLAAKVVIKEYLPEEFAFRALDNTVQARDDMDQEFYQNGLDSFLVEARTLATFRHRHIVRVARFFEANKTAYMVLEYERGQSLKSWRKKRGDNIDETTIVALLAPLLDGLEVVHGTGYLHRDIKPDNIYVRDEDGSLVLLDFGAARQTSIEKSEIGMVVTPGYGPIEQYAGGGRQGPWTDIYSLGATLFWLITGRKPLDAPARLGDPDPLPSAESLGKDRFSSQFLRAVDWALKMHPADRPQEVAQFRSALFASHAGALGLQEALRRGDDEGFNPAGVGSWSSALRSPRLMRGKLDHLARAMRRPASWPIAIKMTLAMVATALAPMVITSYYNLNAAQNHVAAVELRNLEQLAQNTAGRISQLIFGMRGLADYVGTDDDFVAYLQTPTREGTRQMLAKLEGLGRAHRDIQFSMVMDATGDALVASDPDVMGKNFRFREYFKRAMEGESYMTGIIVGSVAGAAGFFFSRPVFAPDGKVIGAVVLRVRADPVGRIVGAAKLDNDRIPFLIDGDGVVIWHPDERQMFKSLMPLAPDKLKEIVADKRFRRETIESINQPELAAAMRNAKDRGHVSYKSTVTQREEIAGYSPVPGNDWVVGISESRDYFAAPLDRLFEKVLISVLLAGAIFAALASMFARSIVRPIQKLTAAAHALKSGDYGKANVEVRSNDEVGQLARVFTVMIDVLRQREREREGRRAAIGFKDEEPPAEK
ncbi:MAG: HAMP domain-containing protein [Burkholderiales bacterium]|nr:HAMP domain-containing protein [Burkholderiales bacterium]